MLTFAESAWHACIARRKKAILVYPGLLVTRELLEALDDFCYCPTALDLPSLDYPDEKGSIIHISVVGDPTAAGAILNDGDPANRQSEWRASM